MTATAAADPSDRPTDRPAEVTHDYSRFSDGPRRVPAPRGASLRRSEALGLGTRAAATALLHRQPDPRWVEAAAWRGREVERLLWPVDDGRYVRGFGFVRQTRPDLRHDGVDIGAPVGATVRAAADGIVAYSDNGIRGYGNCVILVHPNGWVSLYAHNSRTTVQPGWRVRRGERIAQVGNTGISRGPHLHFELHDGGTERDPLALFDGGPAYVQRVAAQAFRAGRVSEPQAPAAEDRAAAAPLPPWQSETPAAAAPVAATSPARVGRLTLGSRQLLQRLLRFRPTDEMLASATGRRFRNLLWPVRDAPDLDTDEAHAVRATMDGTVVFASVERRRGRTIALLHPTGWVTVYSGLAAMHVEAGDTVERGEWIGRTAAGGDGLDFELRVDGRRVDPEPLFRNRPAR